MIRATSLLAVLLAVVLLAVGASSAAGEDSTASAAEQYRSLVEQFEQEGGARSFAPRFLQLAEKHPRDPVAVAALLWVVQNVRGRSETTQALQLLEGRHITDKQLGAACQSVARSRSPAAEKLLRAAGEKSPHADVRAQACYRLALLLDAEAGVVEQLRAAPELAPRVLQYYGKDYGKHLASLRSEDLAREREQAYQTLSNSYADVKQQDTTLGKIAEQALFAIRHLAVGKQAPEIEGQDIAGKNLKLSDYRGKVVMLTFWGHW